MNACRNHEPRRGCDRGSSPRAPGLSSRRSDPRARGFAPGRGLLVGLSVSLLVAAGAARAEDLESFLKKVASQDGAERRGAWESAAAQGAAAVAPLAALASGENKDAALAALRAIDRIGHASAAPGSTTRPDVAKAVAAVLEDPKAALGVRQHVLDLLGSIGGDEVVPTVARALADTEVRDYARKALERIPGDAAARALLAATQGATGEWLDALINTLGTKKATCCAKDLARIAETGAAGSVAAATALTRIADPATVPVILNVIKKAPPRERAALTDDLVRMADIVAAKGEKDIARRIYGSVLVNSQDDGPRYAALLGLARSDPQANVPALMEAVGDRSAAIRSLALELLETVEGTDINKELFARIAEAKGARKAALLRVLANRKAPGVEARIQEAIADSDIDVKVTALELAGKIADPANEPALVAAFEQGSPAVKAVAFGAYLGLADARLGADPKAAEAMYLRVLGASKEPGDLSRSLIGLGNVGNPANLPKVEEARKSPDLVQAANQAYVLLARAVGKAGEKDRAVDMLLGVLSSGASRETVQLALAGLKDLGGDPTAYQKKQGLLCSWFVVGPFPNDGGRGFDAVYSPEKEVSLTEQVDERGRKRKWAEFHSTDLGGKVDLRQVFQRSNDVCAYTYAELELPEAMDVKVKLGSDDGVVCWVNGKKVHANNATRPCAPDSDVVDGVRLEKGVNRFLLKITQGGGEWEFVMRITDREDRPIDLTRFKGPAGAPR